MPLVESGGASLTVASIPDGGYLLRSGGYLSGVTNPPSAAGITLSVGAQTLSSGTAVFSSGNNVTFGMTGSTVTATYAGAGGITLVAGAGTASSGTATFNNGNAVSFGMSGNSVITASVGTVGPAIKYYINLQGVTLTYLSVASSIGYLSLAPLNPYDPFEGDLTAQTLDVQYSFNLSGNTSSWVYSLSAGLYTMVNTTQLTLVNTASMTFGTPAATNATYQSSYLNGVREMQFLSSMWSSVPVLSFGQQYWLGFLLSTAGAALGITTFGISMQSSVFSGSMGVGNTESTASRMIPFLGVSTTTTNAFPASIGTGDIGYTNSIANFVPVVQIRSAVGL